MPSQTVEQLTHICNAESVALVGASDKEGSFGRLFLEGLRDAGCRRIYPVNPKREEILGIKAYPSISAVPDQIDLAILLTPTGVGPRTWSRSASRTRSEAPSSSPRASVSSAPRARSSSGRSAASAARAARASSARTASGSSIPRPA